MKITTTFSPEPESTETSFRLLLVEELSRRCTNNPQYSLRAFARDLEIDHSTLSKLLRGQRKITTQTIENLGSSLKLDDEEIQQYSEHQKRWDIINSDSSIHKQLTDDVIRTIAEWHHFAILELTHLPTFVADSRWIARMLDITVDEINIAIQRLIRLKLLSLESADTWVDTSSKFYADGAVYTSEALKKLWQLIEDRSLKQSDKEGTALPVLHENATFRVNLEQLHTAREVLARARFELTKALAKDSAKDALYLLSINLIPITPEPQKGDKENE